MKYSTAFRRAAATLTPATWGKGSYEYPDGRSCGLGAVAKVIGAVGSQIPPVAVRAGIVADVCGDHPRGVNFFRFNDHPDTTFDDVVTAMLFVAEALESEGL